MLIMYLQSRNPKDADTRSHYAMDNHSLQIV